MRTVFFGGEDTNTLRTFVEERVQPRIAAVKGVANVLVFGGAPEEITVRIDSDKCSALGISPQSISQTLSRSVQRLKVLGGLEDSSERKPVILDEMRIDFVKFFNLFGVNELLHHQSINSAMIYFTEFCRIIRKVNSVSVQYKNDKESIVIKRTNNDINFFEFRLQRWVYKWIIDIMIENYAEECIFLFSQSII